MAIFIYHVTTHGLIPVFRFFANYYYYTFIHSSRIVFFAIIIPFSESRQPNVIQRDWGLVFSSMLGHIGLTLPLCGLAFSSIIEGHSFCRRVAQVDGEFRWPRRQLVSLFALNARRLRGQARPRLRSISPEGTDGRLRLAVTILERGMMRNCPGDLWRRKWKKCLNVRRRPNVHKSLAFVYPLRWGLSVWSIFIHIIHDTPYQWL